MPEVRPATFLTCLAGLVHDCRSALGTIARATRPGDEVVVVAAGKELAVPYDFGPGFGPPLRTARVPYGLELSAQYEAGSTVSERDVLIVVGAGADVERPDLGTLRSMLDAGQARATRLGTAVAPSGCAFAPVLVMEKQALLDAGGFSAARDDLCNHNGTIGALGTADILGAVVARLEASGGRVEALTDGRPPRRAKAPAARWLSHSEAMAAALAEGAADVLAFLRPYLAPEQWAHTAGVLGARPGLEPFTVADWVSAAKKLGEQGHKEFVATMLVRGALSPVTVPDEVRDLASVMVSAGVPFGLVALALAHAGPALEEYLASLAPSEAAELLEQWWAAQPERSLAAADRLSAQLPAEAAERWHGRARARAQQRWLADASAELSVIGRRS